MENREKLVNSRMFLLLGNIREKSGNFEEEKMFTFLIIFLYFVVFVVMISFTDKEYLHILIVDFSK